MEMDEQNKKFLCKFCNKSYPCGKSLGGHLRSHRNVNLADGYADDDKPSEVSNDQRKNKREFKFSGEAGGQSSYVLREKPKKTWVFSNSNNTSKQQVRICKECGKGFQSVKALCGHMACHSNKEKAIRDKSWWGSIANEKQKNVIVNESNTDSSCPARSRRNKYKGPPRYSSSYSVTNGSSSASEVEQGPEEVALCLMMLSRDTSNWGGVNSHLDSSGNRSGSLELKPSSTDGKNGLNYVTNGGEHLGRKQQIYRKLESDVIQLSDNSDSDYFMSGIGKVDSDVSSDRLLRNDDFKRPKVRYGSTYQQFKSLSQKTQNCFGSIKCISRKNLKNGSSNVEISINMQKISGSNGSTNRHNENAKLTTSCSSRITRERGLSSSARKRTWSKRSKRHECPFCFKIFQSGQALGGHKRIHFANGTQERSLVIGQDLRNQLDLNLPTPIKEEVNG